MESIISNCPDQMEKKIEHLEKELSRVRTGRASVNLLEGIRVDYYGAPTPINQVASLSTPDARTILITPFEKKSLGEIERAIHIADIGIQPNNDGNVIRLPIPPLNEDRRKDIAKSIKKIGEDAKVNIRKVRQDFNNQIKKLSKSKEINEDDSKSLQTKTQEYTDHYCKVIDKRIEKKEQEILKV